MIDEFYNCEFCNVIELFGRKSRTKTVTHVINELQHLQNLGYRGHIFFVDDNFLGNSKHAEELLLTIGEWSKNNKYPFYCFYQNYLQKGQHKRKRPLI